MLLRVLQQGSEQTPVHLGLFLDHWDKSIRKYYCLNSLGSSKNKITSSGGRRKPYLPVSLSLKVYPAAR